MLQTLLLALTTTTTGALAALQSCPSDSPFSCQNNTAVADSCCFNAPGGALLQTQFWDTDPATGPADSWTIHGLWYVHTPLRMNIYSEGIIVNEKN